MIVGPEVTIAEASPLDERRSSRMSLFHVLARGGTAVTFANGLERGFGFLANVLAARIAGPQSFGAYSLVLTTANTVSSYAGMGIGTTASRFSAESQPNTLAFRNLLRSLVLVSLISVILGSAVMLFAAAPLAQLALHKPALTSLLRLAAVTVGGAIALECCRGLLLGQHEFRGLIFLSASFGITLALLLPLLAFRNTQAMVLGQAAALLTAALIGGAFALRMVSLRKPSSLPHDSRRGSGVGSVMKFGAVQFSALMSISVTTWLIASLVTRCDGSLTQMGYYAAAGQMRNLAAMLPGILSQVSFPLLTDEKGPNYGGAGLVLGVNSCVVALIGLVVGGSAIIVLPWLFMRLYGRSYAGAELAAVLAIATAVVHMSSMPAANRLLIVSLRMTGLINTLWAVVGVGLSVLLIPRAGAAGAYAALLATHSVSSVMVLFALKRRQQVPPGLLGLTAATFAAVLGIAALGAERALGHYGQAALAELALLILCVGIVTYFGRARGWLPLRSLRLTDLFGQFSPWPPEK
ncbi:MAG TPA: oligosaccharide flippase family protein [Terracidiphilus sp.]|nr:oligosaccharide flippase family protein [Terracidiphilus sp.]